MDIRFNIFISHDSNDETIAVELKSFLENIFLNSTVYVSGRDLKGGQTWIENIKLSLKTSQVIVSLISKESINNNWIYFETGAGFIDDKSIPLITDGLTFSDLKPPLSLLQSRTLSKQGIESLVGDISDKLGLRKPKTLTGLDNLLNEVEKFLAIRNKELNRAKPVVQKADSPIKVSKDTNQNVDKELQQKYDETASRALNLTVKKILLYKDKFDIPTEKELDSYDFGKLQDLSNAYNIPYPNRAFGELLMLKLTKTPKEDAAQWEKWNFKKKLENATNELNKFEKTI
jgi:hypothetical protein